MLPVFESFQSHDKKAFNGMALMIVKAKKGAKGIIKITVKADGLESGKTEIHID